jgi:hypothetical protein
VFYVGNTLEAINNNNLYYSPTLLLPAIIHVSTGDYFNLVNVITLLNNSYKKNSFWKM